MVLLMFKKYREKKKQKKPGLVTAVIFDFTPDNALDLTIF